MRSGLRIVTVVTLGLLLLPGCSGNSSNTNNSGGAPAGAVGNVSDDARITQAAQAKIDSDPALKAAGVKAQAKGAQVELTGTVKSVADKDKAEALAREAIQPFSKVNAGVVNNIEIAESGGADTGAAGAGSGK